MNELALFAGAGGGILGGKLLGWRTVCAVERDAYAAQVLAQRQNDGILEPFPIWSDVESFDGKPWRGIVDVVSGGFPCQDISCAGNGAGIEGERSGQWKQMHRIVCEVQPRIVWVENSPMLTGRGLGVVLGDLATSGYDAEWGVLSASDVGANHERKRMWILAYSKELFRNGGNNHARISMERKKKTEPGNDCWEKNVAYADSSQLKRNECTKRSDQEYADINSPGWWKIEPNVGRMVDELAFRVDRLKAIGNGQVPQCAAEAFRQLISRI